MRSLYVRRRPLLCPPTPLIDVRVIDDNVIKGDALAIDTKSSFVSSDEALVTVLGVEDLVVVATMDAVLVLPPDRTQDV